jgi:hypothetical protein
MGAFGKVCVVRFAALQTLHLCNFFGFSGYGYREVKTQRGERASLGRTVLR